MKQARLQEYLNRWNGLAEQCPPGTKAFELKFDMKWALLAGNPAKAARLVRNLEVMVARTRTRDGASVRSSGCPMLRLPTTVDAVHEQQRRGP